MPELPEVETVVRGLKAVLPGRRIVGVRLGKTDFIDDPAALERDVPGSRIKQVHRHGKFIVLELSRERARNSAGELSLLVHLGMTGQLVVYPAEAPARPHTHVFFALDDGCELRYTDIRRFGRMCVLPDSDQATVLGPLGLDPLEASEAQFSAAIHARKSHIKALLLDQTVLRGMGNIYTDESLWRAKIHPRRLGVNLTPKELRRLHRAVQDVLNEAIRSRGSSISDYVDSAGEQGEFQLKHRAYDREGKKCFRCGTTIRRIIVAGRSSYFCPHCQRGPRQSKKLASKRTTRSKKELRRNISRRQQTSLRGP